MQFRTIGDVSLHHAFDAGRPGSVPLVFANSLGTDFRIWDALLPHLGGGFSILRHDQRGHGLSGLGHTPYAIADLAADLAGLMDGHGLSNAVVCGLSVGGLVAQALAASRPDLVRALVLCDTAHKIGTQASWNERIAAVEARGIEAIADGVLEKWFTPAFHRERADELAGCRTMLTRQPVAGYAATCVALREADHTGLVQSLAVPALCIAGDQDGSTPPALVRSMADLIPGAEFVVIDAAGHIPCIEEPKALADAMRRFLAKNGIGDRANG